MAKRDSRLDGAEMQGSGMITQEVIDRVIRKNGRARKRMARRFLRKAFSLSCREIGIEAARRKLYTSIELELWKVADERSAKTRRKAAKRMKDINKSVQVRLGAEVRRFAAEFGGAK